MERGGLDAVIRRVMGLTQPSDGLIHLGEIWKVNT